MVVNPVSNETYVANSVDNTVTIINGATLATSTVTVGSQPADVEVNPATYKIYVTNFASNSITMIDGATHHTTTLGVGSGPGPATVNPLTNRYYDINTNDNTVSVVQGAGAAAVQFVSMPPCRLVDTRTQYGGSGPIPGGTAESFPLPQEGTCGSNIPANVAAYSLNITVVPPARLGFITVYPTGEVQPPVSLMNSLDGRTKANAAIVPAGYLGAVSVYANNTSDVLIDINGYFVPPSGSTLAFYPMTPCRIVDTRDPTRGSLGAPSLAANQERDFPVTQSSCIPSGPAIKAYSFNVTAVPEPDGQRLGFLAVWPEGTDRPNVSTLNNPTGTIVANGAIVPVGTGGGVAVYPNDTTDMLIDINGYFAAPGAGGLSLYPAAPCRVLDTRQAGGEFSGELPVNVEQSACGPSASAQAYVLNATVVPQPSLGFLTLWPDGENRPDASTLNAKDGAITSNMAIVQTTNGSIDSYANSLTQMILDISSYFAP
jgi:YVTN family beta-propeller protein